MVPLKAYGLVVFCENLQSRGCLVSIYHLSFVALERTLANKHSLPYGFSVLEFAVQLIEDETTLLLVSWPALMTLTDQIVCGINDLMRLDGQVAMRFSQKVHVWAVAKPDEQLILEDASDFAQTAVERTLFQGLYNSIHRN